MILFFLQETLISSLWCQRKCNQVGRGADTARHQLPVGVGAEALICSLGSQELCNQVGAAPILHQHELPVRVGAEAE